jgi:hydrogenase maturation protein HypF
LASLPLPEEQSALNDATHTARHILVQGLVQGVGFRPFIYRLALKHHLSGWVRNCLGQVEIHAQGAADDIAAFEAAIFTQAATIAKPIPASSVSTDSEDLHGFTILDSIDMGASNISVPADLFTCDACLSELSDPSDRRYRYPFINCTQCGPRYTLIRALPYDRANTTMVDFELCADCLREYEDPLNRRYHAEPVACPVCGPTLEYKNSQGITIHTNESALAACVADLNSGKVVAVKGVGGYHLMCDAGNDAAVGKLRASKPRPDKPLALMFPAPLSNPFAHIEQQLELSPQEKEFLASPARPILLVTKPEQSSLSEQIAPGLHELGIMLPYSPLHHLLLNDFAKPLIATSANLRGEPVLINNSEVERRLGHVAEAFLQHNRPIARPADDPVFRTIKGRARPIRLGRGSAPLELRLPFSLDRPTLAVGAHMKNTVTLAWDDRAVVSPHIGLMDNARSLEIFERTIEDLQRLYRVTAETILHDAHPGYTTTRWAKRQNRPVSKILHHHAHAACAYYTSGIRSDMLAFTWDGVGYGDDGTLWGGEALLGRPGQWQRFATLRPFHLPGGERASREPWRSAAALCWEAGIDCPALPGEDNLLYAAWQQRLNTPTTTSAGRLFDAAAALTGLCTHASYEGQGPMYLEACYTDALKGVDLPLNNSGIWQVDWLPLVGMLLDNDLTIGQRSSCFHWSLARSILQQSLQARAQHGIIDIGLSGGVFQNRILVELAADLLEADGFTVHIPESIPLNDAGISFGQIIESMYQSDNNRE